MSRDTDTSTRAIRAALASLEELEDKPKIPKWDIFGVFLTLALMFPVAYLRGFVAVKLWDWFGAPIWPSVHLTIYSAVGLMVLLGLFSIRPSVKESDGIWTALITSIIVPLFLWGTSAIWVWLQWGI